MKKLDLGQMITLLANLGVIAGIIFLGFELRQNTAATQASSRDTVIETDIALLQMLIDSPTIGLSQYEQSAITDLEYVELDAFITAVSRSREHQWLQYQNGLLDRRTLDSFLTGLTGLLSRRQPRAWWDQYAYAYFDDEFVDEVNDLIVDMPISDNGFPNISRDFDKNL